MNIGSRSHLDYALAYAKRELRVFPLHSAPCGDCSCGRDACTSIGKHPRTNNGVKDATTDCEQIRHWWTSWPEANIGIATGNGLYVIDVDSAKGATMASLEPFGITGLMWTLTARTGSGGYHLYLRCEQSLSNTASKLAPFVDTRGEGGYVVAPPSRNKHGLYTWYCSSPVQPVPAELLARLREPALPFSQSLTQPLVVREQPQISANAKGLEKPASADGNADAAAASKASADVAQEARNNFLVSLAGRFRGQGLSAHEICSLLLTLNQERYGAGRHPQGPLAVEELERTIFKSVARWETECGVLATSVPIMGKLTDLMACAIPKPSWLVPGLLSEGLVLFAGKPKLGKSWLALSLALTCALGSEAQGGLALGRYQVEPADVFYLSLEDSPGGFQGRVDTLLQGRPVPENFGYALKWQPLLMGGLSDLDMLLAEAPSTRLVVIDTLARVRTTSKGNGSIYQEDYALMSAIHELTVRHHLTLMLVHHTRKMDSEDTFDEISGSTGLTGGADASMVLKRARGQSDATLHLTGRNIEEQELALTFNSTNCTWTVTGSVADRQVSQSRQEVLALLAQNGTMTPAEIAKALEKPRNTIKALLRRMVQDGTLVKQEQGCYALSDTLRRQQEQEVEEA